MRALIYLPLMLLFTKALFGQTESSPAYRNNQFAVSFYKQLLAEKPRQNLCFSPYSISQAMAMVYAGAKNNTARQMAGVMAFSDQPDAIHSGFELLNTQLQTLTDSVAFILANTLWAQKDYPFLPEYFSLLNKYYQAPVAYANFESKRGRNLATKVINNWVSDQTHKQIENLIEPGTFDPNTRLVVVNALYFYGKWQSGFKPELSYTDTFYGVPESQLRFMTQEQNLEYYTDDLIQAIAIPYQGGKQSLLLLLPQEKNGLQKLEKTLDTFYYNNILNDAQKTKVAVTLPAFSSESKQELANMFIHMGMPDAFSKDADFSGITGKTDLRIDKIIHAAKITLSESGTKAAASTAVVMVRKSAHMPAIAFKANHPFIYLLMDNNTRTILFMGRFLGA